MQGKKIYQEKLFNDFRLSERVPEHNFYRRLQSVLDLNYLYALTKDFYGDSGQKSIDPIVFFKFCLVGYLENLTSDRKLIEHCAMRLDILFFWATTLTRNCLGTLPLAERGSCSLKMFSRPCSVMFSNFAWKLEWSVAIRRRWTALQ